MRRLPLLLPLVALVACGGAHHASSPADVVRAWSVALNRSDDAGAGMLFARNAEVVQSGALAILRTPAEAREFNHSLPCSGRITKLDVRDDFVTATFVLGERPGHECDAPGATASAVFRVRGGKIVLWHQTAAAPASPPV